MQSRDEEARPAAAGEPAGVQDAENHPGREQEQRNETGCPGRVPEERAVHEGTHSGHPPVVSTRPSGLASLAGRLRLSSHPCAARPRMIEAALAGLASTAGAAATQ